MIKAVGHEGTHFPSELGSPFYTIQQSNQALHASLFITLANLLPRRLIISCTQVDRETKSVLVLFWKAAIKFVSWVCHYKYKITTVVDFKSSPKVW